MISFTTLGFAKKYDTKPTHTLICNSDDYCDGWNDGYKSGWCYGRGYGCLEPLVPLCPLPRLGEDGYKAGYNRGFLQGINDHKDRDN